MWRGTIRGYSKVLKQHNFIGGFISNNTPVINEINNETNYNIIVKQSFIDGVFTLFSFGLYTPSTIIVIK
ncbi:MAG: Bor/Iss family lipoprotein [Flavobacteriaceae bacterium]